MPGEDSTQPNGSDRRTFLGLLAVATGSSALAGCTLFDGSETTPTTDPPTTDPVASVTPDSDRTTDQELSDRYERTSYFAGPDEQRPEGVETGTRYHATDTGRMYTATPGGWHWGQIAAPRIQTDSIPGIADQIVTTTAELSRAFDTLQSGETVYIATGTYRSTDWLDVDVDNVTIIGESRTGTLLKPADGANIGGIRIGAGSDPDDPVQNVRIRGIGYHGNDRNQDQSVTRLHGFIVEHAANVRIADCFATRTSPYHQHDRGGSGFTVRRTANNVALVGNYTDDIGDRSIQVAGSNITIARNHLTNGFDRSISLEVRHPDGRKYYSRNVSVVNNLGRDNSQGSIIGASQGSPRREGAGNYAILGNVGLGSHRRIIYIGVGERATNVALVGNAGRQGAFGERRPGIRVDGTVSNFVISGNTLTGYSGNGIEIDSAGSGFTCTGNQVHDSSQDGIYIETSEGTVTGNVVTDVGGAGINASGGALVLSNNTVRRTASHGIALDSGGPPSIISSNLVEQSARAGESADGIYVNASGCVVSTNRVTARDGRYAIAEGDSADDNHFVGNKLPSGRGSDPWNLGGPSTVTFGNSPAPARRETSLQPTDGESIVEFTRPYAEKPVIDLQLEEAVLWSVDWERDEAGNYVGARFEFLDPEGNPANPTARLQVRPSQ